MFSHECKQCIYDGSTMDRVEHEIYEELEFDSNTSTNSTTPKHSGQIRAKIDIMLHPVYQLPCPYITRMCDSSGRQLNLLEAQELIDFQRVAVYISKTANRTDCTNELKKLTRTNTMEFNGVEQTFDDKVESTSNEPDITLPSNVINNNTALRDHRYQEFGRLTTDMHPINDTPCWSMHLCQLANISSDMMQSMQSSSTLTSTVETSLNGNVIAESAAVQDQDQFSFLLPNQSKSMDKTKVIGVENSLFLLNWLCLVGPHIGIMISPALYSLMKEKLES